MGERGCDCKEARRGAAVVDGELDVTVRIQIEQHLADCHGCTERTEFQRHLKLLIAQKCGQEPVPPELEAKVLELIRRLDA
ncbi:MAG: zf-HC2 domain-containing protein [Actinomycetota bacterium]